MAVPLPMFRVLFTALLWAGFARAEGIVPDLTPAQAALAKNLIEGYKTNPKGPFLRIRWFCPDGSSHPPAPIPDCAARRKGRQHAEAQPSVAQLAAMNIDVGTILAALDYGRLKDSARDHWRLKELVLESYLIDITQGWIYRRAFGYRGAWQVEDEERAGQQFLTELFSDPEWLERNYLLANQIVAVIPHGRPDGTLRKIRNLAAAVADKDGRFQVLRAKIHSRPGPEDIGKVEEFRATRSPRPEAAELIDQLLEQMKKREMDVNAITMLPALLGKYEKTTLGPVFRRTLAAFSEGSAQQAFTTGAEATLAIRQWVEDSRDGARNLELLDVNALVHERAFAMLRPGAEASRAAQLERLFDDLRYATGAGMLSFRQWTELEKEMRHLLSKTSHEPLEYRRSLLYVGRAAEWSRAAVAKEFGPVARHWGRVEPASLTLVDAVLRGSMALRMTAHLDPLLADANRAAGVRHSIFGAEAGAGVAGLNPGVAVGRLEILMDAQQAGGAIDPRGIYVIPETVSELKTMAGILTLDSGNALSHAQILAANLGIPNAVIPSSLLPEFKARSGRDIFFAVTPRAVVILKSKDELNAEEKALWAEQPASGRPRIELDTSRLRLDDRRIRLLTEVSSADSGVSCGPKAANLGQLASYFPAEVSPGLVIPFGVFAQHIDRDLDGSGQKLARQIAEAFQEVERMRELHASPEAILRFIQPKLKHFRDTIERISFLPEFERDVVARMESAFGPDGSYGVFVRSDTNAEDLPQFTGAGLNRTVPHRVGMIHILQAIRDVWASPYSDRAFEWRNRALKGTDRVYPSVIIQRTVPSEKSGVIATVNLETGDRDEITVNVNEGVAAVVDGGVAESLLLRPDGGVRLLAQSRATYRKVALPEGGFRNVPASGSDYVLAKAEIEQLRIMVERVKRLYPPVRSARGDLLPWDIEFGFEKGALRLFQIRPLVRFQELDQLMRLARLEGRAGTAPVRLDEPVR
jgi:hypothetical protein